LRKRLPEISVHAVDARNSERFFPDWFDAFDANFGPDGRNSAITHTDAGPVPVPSGFPGIAAGERDSAALKADVTETDADARVEKFGVQPHPTG
jgi:hypothetical protein